MLTSTVLRAGPGQLVEYLADAEVEALAETLVAFANSDGGTLLLGVDENGKPNGHVFPDEAESALRGAEARCRPAVQVKWEQVDMTGATVVAVHVSRSTELHSLNDGRVLVRMGVENRPLGGEAIRQLAATKSSADYESETVPGASRADLDDAILAEFVEKREERQRKRLAVSPDEMLHEIGALDASGYPTMAGVLLFGKNPQQFIPQSGLVFVKFIGTEPRGEGGLPGYGRREEISGPLARVIETAWEAVWEEMHVGAVVKGLQREEKTEYPPFAVREALVNAVCHRDYRLKGRRIEIRMFADRLEVISPGGLPGFITVDNIVEEHFSRNPRIVAGLFQWGYIEELGLGIDRMIEEMTQAGHPAPHFKATPYSFTVTLSNAHVRRATPAWEKTMNERQARALAYIREHGQITNREYQQICPDVTAETLRLDLVDLVNRGIILRIGAKKGTYYIMK
ncbi:MAG TPA: ATP-binding protein [Anaerolineae bacterium]